VDGTTVKVTDTAEACQAAARPDVDEAYFNHCVYCELSFVEAEDTATFYIPTNPVVATAAGAINGKVGMVLSLTHQHRRMRF